MPAARGNSLQRCKRLILAFLFSYSFFFFHVEAHVLGRFVNMVFKDCMSCYEVGLLQVEGLKLCL